VKFESSYVGSEGKIDSERGRSRINLKSRGNFTYRKEGVKIVVSTCHSRGFGAREREEGGSQKKTPKGNTVKRHKASGMTRGSCSGDSGKAEGGIWL